MTNFTLSGHMVIDIITAAADLYRASGAVQGNHDLDEAHELVIDAFEQAGLQVMLEGDVVWPKYLDYYQTAPWPHPDFHKGVSHD